jgi:hypothetical protein
VLLECMRSYFEEADNIVDKWRYIFVLNFYTYREWWEKTKANEGVIGKKDKIKLKIKRMEFTYL